MFHCVTCKLGNMRKADEFVIYPLDSANPETVLIQADKRIAKVHLASGKALLSDGKGGHQGCVKLSKSLGAKVIDVPPDVLAALRAEVAKMSPGPVILQN